MMKKLISMVFVLIMIFCMTGTAMAENGTVVKNQVTVIVKLNQTLTGEFRNVQGQLNYDPDVLAYVSHTMGTDYADYASKDMPEKKYFTFSRTDMSQTGFTTIPKGTIAVVTFEHDGSLTDAQLDTAFNLKLTVQDTAGNIEPAETRAVMYVIKNEADVPATPKLSIGNVASSGAIKLSWAAVPGAEEYVIQRSVGNDDNYVAYKTTTNTSFTNTAVNAGKTYYYRVKAVGTGGASDWAYEYQTCDLTRPEISISNVASSGTIKLSWKAVEGADRYEIQRSVGNDENYVAYKTTTSTSFTNTATTAGKTYYYRVRAIYDGKSSANSAWDSEYQTCDLAAPVITVSGTKNPGKIVVSWSKVSGADRYYIYRATSKTGTYSKYSSTTGTTWTNSSVTEGKTYYYKVKAVYDGKSTANSAYSNMDYARVR